ncbi:small membrane protein YdgU [Kosakonia sacchari]
MLIICALIAVRFYLY